MAWEKLLHYESYVVFIDLIGMAPVMRSSATSSVVQLDVV